MYFLKKKTTTRVPPLEREILICFLPPHLLYTVLYKWNELKHDFNVDHFFFTKKVVEYEESSVSMSFVVRPARNSPACMTDTPRFFKPAWFLREPCLQGLALAYSFQFALGLLPLGF